MYRYASETESILEWYCPTHGVSTAVIDRREQCGTLGGVTFEWDARKAAANFRKHGVTFEDGSSVFFDPLAITYPDPDHSWDERREVTLG